MRIFSIFLCVFLNAVAPLLFKCGANSIDGSKPLLDLTTIKSIVINVYVLSGLALYAIAALLWLYVLTSVRLSYAYPFLSLSYVLVIFLSKIGLREPITSQVWLGIILIAAGLSIIGFFGKG